MLHHSLIGITPGKSVFAEMYQMHCSDLRDVMMLFQSLQKDSKSKLLFGVNIIAHPTSLH